MTICQDRDQANTVSFAPGVDFTRPGASGGSGSDRFVTRGTDGARASLEYLFDTGWGDHSLKIGYNTTESQLFENTATSGDPPATFISLSPIGRADLTC